MKEVYVARGVDGEVLYVGQGNLGRNVHCLNGTSHNKHINRYFFQNGEDGCITTEVLHTVKTQEEAFKLEKVLIDSLSPPYNTIRYLKYNEEPKERVSGNDFRNIAKLYYECKGLDKDVVELVSKTYPQIIQYTKELGIDMLKTTGFQESKLKHKITLNIGAKELETNRSQVRVVFELNKGQWYSLKDIKDRLTKAYMKLGFLNKAFASDVSKFYVTKRAKRNSIEGVVVLDIV